MALYDTANTWAMDDEFFLGFINERPASRVLDLGCGTGRSTLAVAAAGHCVVGIDPDSEALAAARGKPEAGNVDWVSGTSAQIPEGELFDVAITTSHVAQALSDDVAWARTLGDLHRTLLPGGRLVVDSRDPVARAWERWTPVNTLGTCTLLDGITLETWNECTEPEDGCITMTGHRRLRRNIEETYTSVLAFRSEAQLREDIATAGFSIERVNGGWNGEAVGSQQGELIVIAGK